MAIDWTVALYILLPLLCVILYHYVTWWMLSLLIRMRLRITGVFHMDVDRELRYRWRYAALLLAQVVERRGARTRRRPRIWRRSQPIFQERNQINALTELCIKSFLRNRIHWMTYLRLVAMFTFVIVMLPSMFVVIAWIIAGLTMAY